MREILFRAKRDKAYCASQDWTYGVPFIDYEGDCIFKTDTSEFVVDAETVGQYTGLTDKNGKKIFEGDIFLIEDDMIAVIIFHDGCFRLKTYGQIGVFTESGYDECGGGYGVIECEPIDWYYIHDMQIVGNIHDNPELIKGGE